MFIHISIWISVRELHHHAPGGSDDLPSQKNILQAEGLDLLPVFRCPYHVNLEQQKQIVSQHHQLEDGFFRHRPVTACLQHAIPPGPGDLFLINEGDAEAGDMIVSQPCARADQFFLAGVL